jgi:hypothetical protein
VLPGFASFQRGFSKLLKHRTYLLKSINIKLDQIGRIGLKTAWLFAENILNYRAKLIFCTFFERLFFRPVFSNQ